MERNVSIHNTITNVTKNNSNKYSSLHCLELMWYKMHMLHFIDMQFFGLFGFQFCLTEREKMPELGEHVYQEFVMLKMFTVCIKLNNLI